MKETYVSKQSHKKWMLANEPHSDTSEKVKHVAWSVTNKTVQWINPKVWQLRKVVRTQRCRKKDLEKNWNLSWSEVSSNYPYSFQYWESKDRRRNINYLCNFQKIPKSSMSSHKGDIKGIRLHSHFSHNLLTMWITLWTEFFPNCASQKQMTLVIFSQSIYISGAIFKKKKMGLFVCLFWSGLPHP